MGLSIEHERKFLIRGIPEGACRAGTFRQGYLLAGERFELRVRTGDRHAVTAKFRVGPARRLELEFPGPPSLLKALTRWCRWGLSKSRWELTVGGQSWEIDEYHESLEGVFTAELELDAGSGGSSAVSDGVELPEWVGREITEESGWSNRALARYGKPAR